MPRSLAYKKRTTEYRVEQSRRYQARSGSKWIDPHPNVHGTLPEKMVYAALSARGIPFLFLNDITFNIPEIDFIKEYQADFVLPTLRIIIEVQGAYWHSKPATIEEDAFKLAIYAQAGYKPLAWWDFDIIDNLSLLFAQEPLLNQFQPYTNLSSELPVQSRKKPNTSKGIITLNKKRALRNAYKKRPVGRRIKTSVKYRYKV
jgi:hypothetical protein